MANHGLYRRQKIVRLRPTIDASLAVGMVGGVKQLLLICAVVALVG